MSGAYLLLLGSLFLVAAAAKFRDREQFSKTLAKLFPLWFSEPISWLIPLIEFVVGLLLLSGIAVRQSLGVALMLLLAFTVALTEMWRRGLKNCGCFGDNDDAATPAGGIARNLLLVTAGLGVLRCGHDYHILAPSIAAALGRFTVAAGTICLWLCATALAEHRKYLRPARK